MVKLHCACVQPQYVLIRSVRLLPPTGRERISKIFFVIFKHTNAAVIRGLQVAEL